MTEAALPEPFLCNDARLSMLGRLLMEFDL
jgi:hypothetical protein